MARAGIKPIRTPRDFPESSRGVMADFSKCGLTGQRKADFSGKLPLFVTSDGVAAAAFVMVADTIVMRTTPDMCPWRRTLAGSAKKSSTDENANALHHNAKSGRIIKLWK